MARSLVTLVVTVLNEKDSIVDFISSIFSQTKIPDEVVIVDGGSRDGTIAVIKTQVSKQKSIARFKILTKKGNRSVGRNEGIRRAKGEIILISDAGCVLDRNWVKKISDPFKKNSVDVVAGYYKGIHKSILEKSLIPYVLVMPGKINPKNFLPSTRSMAIRKEVWKESGGFREDLSHNEDYVFAKTLEKKNKKIVFVKEAIVYWIPRQNLSDAFVMFFRFALGDFQAGIIRSRVILIFIRYFIFTLITAYSLYTGISPLFIFSLMFLYIFWSIIKNYKYVKHWLAFIYLPILQITSDIAVISGSLLGIVRIKKYGIHS